MMMRLSQLFVLAALVAAEASANDIRGGSTTVKAPPARPASPFPRKSPLVARSRIPVVKKENEVDTVEKFAADVAKVLHELRADRHDPTVNTMYHSDRRPTFAVTWTHNMWEEQTSRWRFVSQILHWPKSALVKRVMPQLTVLMVWTAIAIHYMSSPDSKLAKINFPMASLSLVSGFVASLLGIRTSQSMSRLLEARQSFGKVVHYTRDMSSLVSHFIYDKDPQLALLLARHLATFSWLLKNFLRGRKVSGTDEDLIRTMLPNPADADYVLQQRKMPVAVVMRLRQALADCSHKHILSTAEELAIDHTIQHMDLSIMVTERLVASPIPPLFTSHAGRLMTVYLFFLPIALQSMGSLSTTGILTTVFAVGYAMLGLDEMSHMQEQPFRVNPLYHLCKNSMRDVADAFCVRPPALRNQKDGFSVQVPPYWKPEEEYCDYQD